MAIVYPLYVFKCGAMLLKFRSVRQSCVLFLFFFRVILTVERSTHCSDNYFVRRATPRLIQTDDYFPMHMLGIIYDFGFWLCSISIFFFSFFFKIMNCITPGVNQITQKITFAINWKNLQLLNWLDSCNYIYSCNYFGYFGLELVARF